MREREGSEGEVGREYHRMKASVHPLSSIQQYNMIINKVKPYELSKFQIC